MYGAFKPFLAASLLVASAPVAPVTNIDPAEHPEISYVRCIPGMGSAFRVGPTVMVSVAHVTSLGGCMIDGKPINVVNTKGDFAVLSSPDKSTHWLHIDCNGFVAGRKYIAIGFARGRPVLTSMEIEGTGIIWSGFYRLNGMFNVIPGMSGGPVLDAETGEVVGTINVYNFERGDSGSTELRDTSLCAKA